jgi:2-polyprenyl-3-methyl-5-hydroxy-6-metoxy-1,4-benzoquinol methylase
MGDAPTPADVVAAWDELAAFWDARSGPSGSEIHRLLIAPSMHRLLGVTAGETILDVGCGNGVVTRELTMSGAAVVGCDASPVIVDIARRRSEGLAIDYHVVDATDEHSLLALGPGRFDGIVASMVLMDLPVIDPLLRAAARLLRARGSSRVLDPPPLLQQPPRRSG